MPPKTPNKTLRGRVKTVRKDRTGFLMEYAKDDAIHEQWFKLSTQDYVPCPGIGDDIAVAYNISPGTEQYPNETWWANGIFDPSKGDADDAYEQQAQKVEQQLSGNGAPKKADPIADRDRVTRESIEKQVILKLAVEIVKAEGWAPDEVDITQKIIETTHKLYDGVFGEPPESDLTHSGPDTEPEPEYTG